MAGFRVPGPTCGSEVPWCIADGTAPLWRMTPPGPVCVASPAFQSCTVSKDPTAPDLGFLFNQCLNPAMGLTDADYLAAARTLDVEVAAIRAVAEVETAGKAFDDLGRPRILFERHYFHRLTSGRFDKEHARISAKSSGGYGKFSAQYGKLEEAYALDADAALRSASWGRFQIMGDNHLAAGHASAALFVQALTKSEAAHLSAFVAFVASHPAMHEALKKKRWAAFAKAYNGKTYKKNLYDTKLQSAYDRLVKEAAD